MKTNPSVSPMSEAFHDWLDQCPIIWYRDYVEDGYVTYSFKIDKN